MKIEVLNIDGMSLAAEAWRLSRDVTLPIEWHDIYTVDSPCNEMPSAFCHFFDFTILEREIFASSRTHVMWARTSFVDSPDKYYVPDHLSRLINGVVHDDLRQKMEAGKAAGQHQDEWRRFLPVSAATAFVMRVSYRDAIKYAKYFDYLSTIVAPNLQERFRAVADEMMILADMFTGSNKMSEDAARLMSMSKFLHEGPIVIHNVVKGRETAKLYQDSGVIVAGIEVPLWIRAHFIRHRPITVADDFVQLLKQPDVLDRVIDYPVKMMIAASTAIWQSLLGKRSCWLTQSTLSAEFDPWQRIIDRFTFLLGDQILPCAKGVCPYHRDARNRIEGTDPGCPCPRYLSINQLEIAPFSDRIAQALKSRGAYWNDAYLPVVKPSSIQGGIHEQAEV